MQWDHLNRSMDAYPNWVGACKYVVDDRCGHVCNPFYCLCPSPHKAPYIGNFPLFDPLAVLEGSLSDYARLFWSLIASKSFKREQKPFVRVRLLINWCSSQLDGVQSSTSWTTVLDMYAIHRTKLHTLVTFACLILLQCLKGQFLTARGSSGHCLFISPCTIV